MGEQFSVQVTVRGYEIDFLGHVNQAVYHQYGEYARTEHLRAAGFTLEVMRANGLGVVLLESRCRYLRELTLGDEVEITSDIEFGTGKSFRMNHHLRRADGTDSAELNCVMGLLDTSARRLVPGPRERIAGLVARPELIGVPGGV